MSSLLKATAVAILMASVLAATAEAAVVSYISTIASTDFLMSPAFFWMTANAIIIWLFSSSRRGRTNHGDHNTTSPSPGHDDGEILHDSVDTLYASSSDYDAFSDASTGHGRRADAQLPPKRLARDREARAARRSDRPRVRKKPAAGQDEPTFATTAAARETEPDDGMLRIRGQRTPVTAAAESIRSSDDIDGDDEDVSMDSLWESIVQRRAALPVVVQKSESWGNDELPRLRRVAETAAATPRREMRKSVSAVTKAAAVPEPEPRQPPPPSVPSAVKHLGWRTRDELVAVTPDDLLRRAESFIRRQWEHLRLQRQESEQRQLQRLFQLRAPAAGGPRPIRV